MTKNNIKDFIEFAVHFDCGAIGYEFAADLETAIILAQSCQIRKGNSYEVERVVNVATRDIVYESTYLTWREFAATLVADLDHPWEVRPWWVCTAPEYQKDMLAKADIRYKTWMEKELEIDRDDV